MLNFGFEIGFRCSFWSSPFWKIDSNCFFLRIPCSYFMVRISIPLLGKKTLQIKNHKETQFLRSKCQNPWGGRDWPNGHLRQKKLSFSHNFDVYLRPTSSSSGFFWSRAKKWWMILFVRKSYCLFVAKVLFFKSNDSHYYITYN